MTEVGAISVWLAREAVEDEIAQTRIVQWTSLNNPAVRPPDCTCHQKEETRKQEASLITASSCTYNDRFLPTISVQLTTKKTARASFLSTQQSLKEEKHLFQAP